MNRQSGTRKRKSERTASGAFLLIAILALIPAFLSPLVAQETEDKKDATLSNPPYMKYFYISANTSKTFLLFPEFFYTAIKVVDNVYDYAHSSIVLNNEKRITTPFNFGGSIGFAFLTYETESFAWVGDIEVGYMKYTFPNGVETSRETTVYYDASESEETRIEATKDLSFNQTERSLTAYNAQIKIGANFISGLSRLFFLFTTGVSYTERVFVSGLSQHYDGKLDLKPFENREEADLGLYKGNGKWTRKNYPINLGLELRYYLFNNFSLNAGWLMHIGRKPVTTYLSEEIYQKGSDIKIQSHVFNMGLSFVF